VEGRCWIVQENQEGFLVEKGSLVIFPHSPAHVMCSDRSVAPVSITSLLPFAKGGNVPKIEFGHSGEKARLICGFLQCDQRFNPLIGALPEVLVVAPENSCLWNEIADGQQFPMPDLLQRKKGDWLDNTLEFMEDEVSDSGSGSLAMTVRLAEILFLEVLKRYIHQLPAESSGWLAGIKDREIGRALRLLHSNPQHKWDIAELAREVGTSRSGLTKRFAELVGEPPIKYLTRWRLQLAKHLLLQPGNGNQQVANQVGYESEEAFSRAFKKYTGDPPASWKAKALEPG
jgi:AraC-like DNA-binding protein